jgi:hypothetical protein
MMSIGFPARITVVGESETDFKIAAETLLDVARTVVAQPIIVHGILVEKNNAGAISPGVTILNGAGTTTLAVFSMSAQSTVFTPIMFVADGGISVTTTANCTCTIWHSQAGR